MPSCCGNGGPADFIFLHETFEHFLSPNTHYTPLVIVNPYNIIVQFVLPTVFRFPIKYVIIYLSYIKEPDFIVKTLIILLK